MEGRNSGQRVFIIFILSTRRTKPRADTWDGMEIHCRITDSTGSDINRTVYKIELS